MASCAVESSIDVALWFVNRASAEDTYLQPQKLQRLLYIAQGCYAQENYGRKLMPATFVTHEFGPIEPNIFRLFESGRPMVAEVPPPAEVDSFLERVWRRFGNHSVDRLTAALTGQKPYREAVSGGFGEEIPFGALVAAFDITEDSAQTIRTADGRRVKKWVPSRSVKRTTR